ncbi:unnamed protein product [Schistosoma curassoni]|uniref:Uncharacterized protein n=1 Tax=Schistosoma curassoni TaxID=6186 RepID=A0A183K148_9TREM|nr:unnamed protein product [Schistosoma curassoni]
MKLQQKRNVRQSNDSTKTLTGKYNKPKRPVKNKECKPITEIQELKSRSFERFKEFLNRSAQLNPLDIEAAHTDIPMDVTLPTTEETRMAGNKKNEE